MRRATLARWLALTAALTAALAAAAAPAVGQAPAQSLAPTLIVGRAPLEARVLGIDAERRLRLQMQAEEFSLPLADLVAWGRFVAPRRAPYLVLVDGSVVVGRIVAADGDEVQIDTVCFGRRSIPTAALAGIVFRRGVAPTDDDALVDRMLDVASLAPNDQLRLENGDVLRGVFLSIRDNQVRFRAEVGEFATPVLRVASLVCNPALRSAVDADDDKTPHFWLGFDDGSRLRASRLIVDEQGVDFDSLAGSGWLAAASRWIGLLPLAGRAEYLSDRLPDEFVQTPYLEASRPLRRDRCVTGAFLRSQGALYLKGLGVQSAAVARYELREPYAQFEAEAAIDEMAPLGSARFRVLVDGVPRYESPAVRGGDPPVPIRVPLAGAKRLELVVEFGERGAVEDHADWLAARLVR